jgi:hypothetical protein
MQCAMEENCLASGAYYEQKTNPSWQMLTRRLLRYNKSMTHLINDSLWQWFVMPYNIGPLEWSVADPAIYAFKKYVLDSLSCPV